jgi:hypothetical protein
MENNYDDNVYDSPTNFTDEGCRLISSQRYISDQWHCGFTYGRGTTPPKSPSSTNEMKHQMADEQHTHEMHSHEMHDHQMQDHEAHQMTHGNGQMHGGPGVPFAISVLIGTSHCGAGCVLGDIVGEWLVYGTSVTINDNSFWPELLIGTPIHCMI